MDFFKALLGAAKATTDGEGSNKSVDEVFERSQELFKYIVSLMQDASKERYDRDKANRRPDAAFNASLMIFLTVWQIVGWANRGVEPRRREKGDDHPVVRLWDLMRAAFEDPDLVSNITKMQDLTNKWGLE